MLFLLYVGGPLLVVGLSLFATGAVWELFRMLRGHGISFFPFSGALWIWLLIATSLIPSATVPVIALGGVGVALIALVNRSPKAFEGAITTSWAALYLGLFFSYLVRIRQDAHGMHLAYVFFFVIWATDTLAYFIGRRWGAHKLLPAISPKKSWEGTIGGTMAGTLVGLLSAHWMGLGLLAAGLFGIIVSVVGQMGDLLESGLKRYTGVKDSGGLLPGHGGILDRFDSALFALPIAYYLLKSLGIS